MPKRPNPFGDCAPLQLKTHVGIKELAAGIRQEELMKSVYEKTHEKLFSGAHRSSDVNDNHVEPAAACSKSPLESMSRFQPSHAPLDSSVCLVPPFPLNGCAAAGGECRDFNGWVDCSNGPSLRCQTTATCLPAASGQMCLNSSGQLMAPAHCAMDCDGDGQMDCGGVAPSGDVSQGKSQVASARGGLHSFGFKSVKRASPMAGWASQMCETCRHTAGSHHCQFCERTVCQGCVRQCDTCGDHFCQLCSTLNYDAVTERAFCLGCVG